MKYSIFFISFFILCLFQFNLAFAESNSIENDHVRSERSAAQQQRAQQAANQQATAQQQQHAYNYYASRSANVLDDVSLKNIIEKIQSFIGDLGKSMSTAFGNKMLYTSLVGFGTFTLSKHPNTAMIAAAVFWFIVPEDTMKYTWIQAIGLAFFVQRKQFQLAMVCGALFAYSYYLKTSLF